MTVSLLRNTPPSPSKWETGKIVQTLMGLVLAMPALYSPISAILASPAIVTRMAAVMGKWKDPAGILNPNFYTSTTSPWLLVSLPSRLKILLWRS